MNAIVYLFQVSACMGIFYLFYYALLSRYTFFTINRWYLIVTLALCFVIPLLTITVQPQNSYPQVIQKVVYINQMQTPQQLVVTDQAPAQVQINWMGLLQIVYTVAVVALLIRLFLMVLKFFTRVKDKQRTTIGGVHIVQGDEQLSNGSFFNFIFLNDDELSADELQQIIAHEMLHVKLYHSVDRILVKVAQVFLWFNPFVYLYARAIEENHEFEVDREVGNATDKNKYAELLFHLSVARQGTLYHNFSMVPLKKRITMLFTKPTNRIKKIIYLLVVPVVLISCLAFAKLKNEESAKTKKQSTLELLDSTATVKYRQKTKRSAAQIKSDDESRRKLMAYLETPEGKKKMALSASITSKTLKVIVMDEYLNRAGKIKGKWIKEKVKGDEFVLFTGYGQTKQLNSELKKGDEIEIKVFFAATGMNEPISVTPAFVIKDGKKIFQLAEATEIPDYPFLYEANKVRYADGQVTNITKYPNGKWKTAVFERVNGYKFNLSFKPNAPDLNRIKSGDHVRLRFVHEVQISEKLFTTKDWVAISTDIKDYGIKNPEWFNKFYEVAKADTGKVSAINGIESLGAKPLVLINGKEYDKDILYKISMRGVRGTSMYPPNNGATKYGEKAKDGAVIIDTRDGEINYLSDNERLNLVKQKAAKGRFFSRIRLTKEDGSEYDMAIINRASGSRASTDLPANGKIAFIINNKVYTEAQFKRLFPKDKVEYSRSIGVGGPSKELTDRGFKLDGYNVVFEFPDTNVKTADKSVIPGAAPQNKTSNGFGVARYTSWSSGTNPGTGKPTLITGGQSNFRGGLTGSGITSVRSYKNFSVVSGEYKPSKYSVTTTEGTYRSNNSNSNATPETKKSGEETIPAAKDTVGNRNKALNETMANLQGFEFRADGTLWFKGQPVNKVTINGKDYTGGSKGQAIKTLPADIIEKVEFNNTPKILVDGKEFIPAEVTIKPKVNNTPKILVDGKEFIPAVEIKKDLLNSVPKAKLENKKLNDSLVAAHFSGKVIKIQEIFDTKLVIIKNGDYFAAYSNLKNVNVSAGQDIKLGQVLGVAAFNSQENNVAVNFDLYRGSSLITNKTEQEVIIRDLGQQRLNMRLKLGEVYAYKL